MENGCLGDACDRVEEYRHLMDKPPQKDLRKESFCGATFPKLRSKAKKRLARDPRTGNDLVMTVMT